MKGSYVVAGYQGRLSYRFVPLSSTTVYMDEELAEFDTEEEAKDYIDKHEDDYYNDNYPHDDLHDYDNTGYACDGCGALCESDCYCHEYD